jgi:copper chaperone CopZ
VGVADAAVYRVPEMHCAHCERAVHAEVSALAGVRDVDVDLHRKVVTVVAEPLDDVAIREAIEAAGYEVS